MFDSPKVPLKRSRGPERRGLQPSHPHGRAAREHWGLSKTCQGIRFIILGKGGLHSLHHFPPTPLTPGSRRPASCGCPPPWGHPGGGGWRGSAVGRGHSRGRGAAFPRGARVGERAPSACPCSGTWWAPRRATAGPAATSAVLCGGGQPRRQVLGSARLGSARPLPAVLGREAGRPPAPGRFFGAGRGQPRLPSVGAAPCAGGVAPRVCAVPVASYLDPLFSSPVLGK